MAAKLKCTCPSAFDHPCTCGRAPTSRVVHISDATDNGLTLCKRPIPVVELYADYVVMCGECARVHTEQFPKPERAAPILPREHNACGTDGCCGTCSTAV